MVEWHGSSAADPQPNNWNEYWHTGTTLNNSIALSGGNDKGSFRLSLGRVDQNGIMYYNDFNRKNFRINSAYNFTPKLNITMSAEYIKSGRKPGLPFRPAVHLGTPQTDWKDQLARLHQDVHIQRAVAGRPADNDPPNWQHTFFTNPYFTERIYPQQ